MAGESGRQKAEVSGRFLLLSFESMLPLLVNLCADTLQSFECERIISLSFCNFSFQFLCPLKFLLQKETKWPAERNQM